MKLNFYTLLYVDSDENRRMQGRDFSQEKRIDIYVRNACVLDKTLQVCCTQQGAGSCTILTNDPAAIEASFSRIGAKIGGG